MTQHDDHLGGHWAVPSSSVALESIRITMELYRTGKSGIQYNKLQQFVNPILSHYQIELGIGFNDEVTTENLDDISLMLDVFETATIFWEYCALGDSEKPAAFQELQNSLLGPSPSEEDLAQFPILIASMESTWEKLTEGETMANCHGFDTASELDLPESAPLMETPEGSYGKDNLDIPEAFAIFSRPMLENEAIYEDPETLDDVMTRAQAYWDVAHLPATDREQHLERICKQFCAPNTSKDQIRKEAHLMIERFHELFPERKQ